MESIQNKIGTTVALISFSMLFATFFLAWFVYRFSAGIWPPLGVDMSLFFPSLSTLTVLASSFSYRQFEKYFQKGSSRSKEFYWQTFLFAGGFLVSQLMLLKEFMNQNFYWNTNIFFSLVYTFVFVHGIHLLFGMIALLSLVKFKTVHRVSVIGKFWHFLAVVWVVIYLFLFLWESM